MNVEIRKLVPTEYGMLASIHDGFVPPKDSIAIVAEKDGKAVGRGFLLSVVHFEGPWVDEDHRGTLIAARIYSECVREAQKLGITKIFAYAVNEKIESYLTRLGFVRSPLTVWTKEI